MTQDTTTFKNSPVEILRPTSDCALVGGALPPGPTLFSNGEIFGTPTATKQGILIYRRPPPVTFGEPTARSGAFLN